MYNPTKHSESMKNLSEILRRIRGSWFWQLKLQHKLIVLYFTLSFCITCGVVDAEPLQLAVLVANFALSAWLVKRVPLPENENEDAA